MRYGRYVVEHYERDFPDDPRIAEAKEKLANLEKARWPEEHNGTPLDRRRAVEQAYDTISDPHEAEKENARERDDRRDEFIRIRKEEIRDKHRDAITAQPDFDLKVGGASARNEAVADFEKQVKENRHDELNQRMQDLTERQAARQEYITNHLVGPSQEKKLEELGLENVMEASREEEVSNDSRSREEERVRAAYSRAGSQSQSEGEDRNKDHFPEYD